MSLCRDCLTVGKRTVALRNSSACLPHWKQWWSERAAIREYEGGETRVEAEREAEREANDQLGGVR